MKNVLQFVLFLVVSYCPIWIYAQIPKLQPDHTYTIHASLEPGTQQLQVTWTLDYLNTSTDTLLQIVLHTWANAFQDKRSAYGEQKLVFGDSDFYFKSSKNRIGYIQLNINHASGKLTYTPYENYSDIIIVALPEPLLPGSRISLQADYALFVPGFHSRMGTDGQIWQFAHWFPKAARYDEKGWHAMPYLEMGEFFQDFANYKVTLQLPDSMVMVSTGVSSDALSIAHRQEAINRSKQGTPGLSITANGRRTWSIDAPWVTDFAWSASKDFMLFDSTITLTNGRTVISQAAYTPAYKKSWANALSAVSKATQLYDTLVGPYPWLQVTAVQSVKGLSGGMEYPMLTFIQPNMPGPFLETVIAHEVGHNWFFGVLATDERTYPWMDEGLNSYYEHRYKEKNVSGGFDLLNIDEGFLLMQDKANTRTLPLPADGVSRLSSEVDYQISAYSIPSQALQLLAKRVGEARVDGAFQDYYRKWAFGHPGPADLRASFETSLGIDLSWLFDDALNQPYYRDMKIKGAQLRGDSMEIQVGNAYQKKLPWGLKVWEGDNQVNEIWYDGFAGKDTIVMIGASSALSRLSVLDNLVPELRRGNNTLWVTGFPKRFRDWRPGFGLGILGAEKPRTYILPEIGYNHHDGWQLGLGVHNQKVYYQPAGFYLGGLYGIESGRINYHGAFYHDVYPGGGPGQLRMNLRVASFSYFSDEDKDLYLAYHRIAPSIELQSREGKINGVPHWRAGIHAWFISREESLEDNQGEFINKTNTWDRIFALRVRRERPHTLQPWHLALDVEFQNYKLPPSYNQSYIKTGLEGKYAYQFMKKKFFHARVFAGIFAHNSSRDAGSVSNPQSRGSFSLAFQGHNDYRFDETFIGRNVQDGFDSRQVLIREGGFKTALGPAFSQGQSNDMIIAVNLWTNLPFNLPLKLPLQPYFDAGFWSDKTPFGETKSFSDQLWWDFGLKLNFFQGNMEIYFPIVQNKQLGDLLEQRDTNYLSRITWTARFDLVHLPWKPMSAFL